MKTAHVVASVLVLSLAACGGSEDKKPAPASGGGSTAEAAKPTLDASSPKALAESIFSIAKSGDLALLATVADPVDADGDSKQVAAVAQAPAEKQADFRKHFSTGTVSGDVKVAGDQAEVPILFGPDGKKPETFKMVKRGDRWHLQSF